MVAPARRLDRSKAHNYLKKAGELYLDMLEARRSSRFNSAVISAVHCGISASDAYTVYAGAVRSVSKDQGDSVKLLYAMGNEARGRSDQVMSLMMCTSS